MLYKNYSFKELKLSIYNGFQVVEKPRRNTFAAVRVLVSRGSVK
jgi:hypothetical protein